MRATNPAMESIVDGGPQWLRKCARIASVINQGKIIFSKTI